MLSMDLYLSHILYPITNLGPEKRIGLWVQGCSMRCPECMSPELFDKNEKNKRSVLEIFEELNSIAEAHSGVTISGGEPFEQANALLVLTDLIIRNTEMDIMIYTGFTLDEILSGSKNMILLLSKIDILVDGPFKVELSNKKLWRGSDNQNIYFLSKRAQKYASYANAEYSKIRILNIYQSSNGNFSIVGIPERNFISQFQKKNKNRGLQLSKRS